ncbi:MAG: hypothetical protein ACYS8Z_15240 [Planctomycetota bacterium]|jgi:hypothetical protein
MSKLSELNFEEAEKSWLRLSTEVLPRMNVSEALWSEDPEPAYYGDDAAERGLLVQCLIDLGYLPEPEDAAGSCSDSEIRTAVAQWRLDAQALPAEYIETNTLFKCREFLAAGEMKHLSAQVGFENEICLHAEPVLGEQSLLTRIVRFRLRTFDLSSEPPTAPYSVECQETLLALCAELKLKVKDAASSRLEMIHLLGNAADLSKLLMKHWGTWLFVFKHDEDVLNRSIAKDLKTLTKSNERFEALCKPTGRPYERVFISCGKHRRLKSANYPGSHSPVRYGDDGFRSYPGSKSSKWINRELERIGRPASVKEAENHLINRLGLELLQLRLWTLGYYQGRIDGEWGPLSFAALQQLLIGEKAKAEKIVFSLENNYVALNLRYLFKRMLPKIDRATALAKLQDVIALEKEMRTQLKKKRTQWSALQKSFEDMEKDEARLYRDKIRRKRCAGKHSILTAFGRMVKSVGRSVKKLAGATVKGIKKHLSGPLQLFRYITRDIRKGLRLVGWAVKRFYYWLAKKPFVTGHPSRPLFVFSRFDWDGDVIHFVQKGAGTYDIRRHHRYLKRLNLAFAIVAKLSIKAIDLIMSTATMNWLMLAWDLYRLITPGFWKEVKAMLRSYEETWEPLAS